MPSCPLKPSVDCAATFLLASSSRCIGCPLLDQCDQAQLICTYRRRYNGEGIGTLVEEASA
jgi:hypothetical protein